MPKPKPLALATRAIHTGQSPNPSTGAIMTPVYRASGTACTTVVRWRRLR